MDDIDLAQQFEEMHRENALSKHRAKPAGLVSMHECIDCGEPISEYRRRAAPGCLRCVQCQERYELKVR